MKLRPFIYVAIALMTVISFGCQNTGTKGTPDITTKTDSVSYALGVLIGKDTKRNVDNVPGADQINTEILMAAFKQAYLDEETKITPEDANSFVQAFFKEQSDIDAQKNLKEGQDFLEANKKKEGVVTLESGLQYEILKEGHGPKPKATDKVKCHYHGTLIDGTVFDSSVDRGKPSTFGVNQVIPGWTEALQLMPVGSKWRLFIPADLAYGERGARGKIKPNSTLIFEVELLDIEK